MFNPLEFGLFSHRYLYDRNISKTTFANCLKFKKPYSNKEGDKFCNYFLDLKSTEFLDDGSNTWRFGPDFPVATAQSAFVTDSYGAFYVVSKH